MNVIQWVAFQDELKKIAQGASGSSAGGSATGNPGGNLIAGVKRGVNKLFPFLNRGGTPGSGGTGGPLGAAMGGMGGPLGGAMGGGEANKPNVTAGLQTLPPPPSNVQQELKAGQSVMSPGGGGMTLGHDIKGKSLVQGEPSYQPIPSVQSVPDAPKGAATVEMLTKADRQRKGTGRKKTIKPDFGLSRTRREKKLSTRFTNIAGDLGN